MPEIRIQVIAGSLFLNFLATTWLAHRFWTAAVKPMTTQKLGSPSSDQVRSKLRTTAKALVVYGLLGLAAACWVLWKGGKG